MLHESYINLPELDKKIFIGSLIHAVLNDEQCFTEAKEMIQQAEIRMVFDGVVIMPHAQNITPMKDGLSDEDHSDVS